MSNRFMNQGWVSSKEKKSIFSGTVKETRKNVFFLFFFHFLSKKKQERLEEIYKKVEMQNKSMVTLLSGGRNYGT